MKSFSHYWISVAFVIGWTFSSSPILAWSWSEALTVSTPIKAAHFNEFRSAINASRSANCLTTKTWSEAIVPGGAIKAAHLNEIRFAIDEMYLAAGLPAPSWTDQPIVPQVTPIRLQHMIEIRRAIDLIPDVGACNTRLTCGSGALHLVRGANDYTYTFEVPTRRVVTVAFNAQAGRDDAVSEGIRVTTSIVNATGGPVSNIVAGDVGVSASSGSVSGDISPPATIADFDLNFVWTSPALDPGTYTIRLGHVSRTCAGSGSPSRKNAVGCWEQVFVPCN